MDWVRLLLAVFATYRAARMVALEEGPGDVFGKFRNLYLKNDWIGRGIRCPLCLSFWFSLVVALLLPRRGWKDFFLLWGGLAGAAAWLEKKSNV